jgi:5-methylthioadenosine/S-adenosylhomocysteine deaminase
MRARGITVSLGADGAACNNRLDMFEEMRLAAILQASGRARAPAGRGTCCGWRRAAGRERSAARTRSGRSSRQAGRRDRRGSRPAASGAGPDPYSTLVYAARGPDVRTTIVDGTVLVDDFESAAWIDVKSSPPPARLAHELATRAGIR